MKTRFEWLPIIILSLNQFFTNGTAKKSRLEKTPKLGFSLDHDQLQPLISFYNYLVLKLEFKNKIFHQFGHYLVNYIKQKFSFSIYMGVFSY